LRARDWNSFDFSYLLDIKRLIPHILAIEEYKTAALSPVLPPRWLEVPDGLGADAADEAAVRQEKPAFAAQAAPPPDLSDAEQQQNQEQQDPAATPEKPVPLPDTSAARAWVKQRFVPGSAPLALADILAIHRMVGEGHGATGPSVGALRTIAVEVGRELVGGFHQGAPAQKLPLLMAQYVEFIDGARLRGLPPVIQALLAHFFLDTIHPFLDGNGRTSRLVAAAILSRHGYNLHGTYALVRYFYRHDVRYHTILQRIWKHRPFEVTPFVAFGMEGFVLELKSVDSFIKMKRNRMADRDLSTAAFRGRIGARPHRPH
jgi:Fic/DOC family